MLTGLLLLKDVLTGLWGETTAPETGGRRSTCGVFVKVREVSELHVSTGQHTVEGFGVLVDKDVAPRTEDMSTNKGKDGKERQQTRAGAGSAVAKRFSR